MKCQNIIKLSLLLVLYGCASSPQGIPTQGEVDLSSERLVSNAAASIATHMIAEIVSIENVDLEESVYQYDAGNRKNIASDSVTLPLGKYRITAVCNDRKFPERLNKLTEVQLKQEIYWWAKFETISGSEGFLPAYSFEVEIKGGELITAVNMAATGNKSCSVIYGQKKLNSLPKTISNTDTFREKYGEKIHLYN